MRTWQGALRKLRGLINRKVPLMITCRELEEFIVEYLEGTLPRRQRIIFKLHLLTCRSCRQYLEAYRRAIAAGRAVFRDPDEPIPGDVPEDLVRAILAARPNH